MEWQQWNSSCCVLLCIEWIVGGNRRTLPPEQINKWDKLSNVSGGGVEIVWINKCGREKFVVHRILWHMMRPKVEKTNLGDDIQLTLDVILSTWSRCIKNKRILISWFILGMILLLVVAAPISENFWEENGGVGGEDKSPPNITFVIN